MHHQYTAQSYLCLYRNKSHSSNFPQESMLSFVAWQKTYTFLSQMVSKSVILLRTTLLGSNPKWVHSRIKFPCYSRVLSTAVSRVLTLGPESFAMDQNPLLCFLGSAHKCRKDWGWKESLNSALLEISDAKMGTGQHKFRLRWFFDHSDRPHGFRPRDLRNGQATYHLTKEALTLKSYTPKILSVATGLKSKLIYCIPNQIPPEAICMICI